MEKIDPEELSKVIMQALGRASMCWVREDLNLGYFDSEKAKKTGEEVLEYLRSGRLPEWLK